MDGGTDHAVATARRNVRMTIRAIIVDDEPLARERIRNLLRDEADVEIVGECADGAEAIDQISRKSPGLLFLDVQMPEIDGFEVLRNISVDELPAVIFTTAHDQHALRAFDAHALDYLLKPYKAERFKEALQRARDQIRQRDAGASARGLLDLLAQSAPPVTLSRLTIRNDERIVFVNVNEIDSIESAGNYAVVHSGKDSHILRESLKSLEERLPKTFFRVSRAAIVNLERVKELQPMFRGESVVILKNGKAIPTSRSLREIQEKLEFH
jgi:two-component system, LytTR family, response regulator